MEGSELSVLTGEVRPGWLRQDPNITRQFYQGIRIHGQAMEKQETVPFS